MKEFLSKGVNLYTTGILLQIQHEVELESVPDPDKQETLKTIKRENKKLFDVIKHFVDYSAGNLPKAALKSFVRQAQTERKLAKGDMGGEKFWWNVKYNNQRMEVVATNKKEAKEVAAKEWGLTPAQADTITSSAITVLRPYDDSPVKAQVGEPQPVGRQNFNNNLTQTDYENRLGWPDQTGDANYEIVDRRTMRRQMVFIANTDQDALRKFEQWLNVAGLPEDTEDFGFRAL